MTFRRFSAIAVVSAALLTGCATAPAPAPAKAPPAARLQQIKYAAQPGANQGNALMVDVVYVFSDDVVATLPLNGLDWFSKKQALTQAFGQSIEVISATIAPGTMGGINTPARKKYVSALVYTSHVDAGAQAAGAIALYKCALITVKDRSIAYSECG